MTTDAARLTEIYTLAAENGVLRRQLAEALEEAYILRSHLVTAIQESATLRQLLTDEQTRTEHLRRELTETHETNAALTRHVAGVIRDRDGARREADQVETQLRNRNADIAELREQLAAERGRLQYEAGAAQAALLMQLADAQSRLIEAQTALAAVPVIEIGDLYTAYAYATAGMDRYPADAAADWPAVCEWLETAQEPQENADDWAPAHRPGKGATMTHDELNKIKTLANAATLPPWNGNDLTFDLLPTEDVIFIVAARTAVPALVAEVERLQEKLAAARIAAMAYQVLSEVCPECEGTGEVDSGAPTPEGGDYYTVTCPWCDGTGSRPPDADLTPERKERLQRYIDGGAR